jgi:hypothetical protein
VIDISSASSLVSVLETFLKVLWESLTQSFPIVLWIIEGCEMLYSPGTPKVGPIAPNVALGYSSPTLEL